MWAPNWSGSGTTTSDIGDLYTVPIPPTTDENPRIGLEGRNEIDLPRAYKDFAVKNLTAENINGTPTDVRTWANYPAINNVEAELDSNGKRQFNIDGFENITASNFRAYGTGGEALIEGTITADVSMTTPITNSLLTANVGSSLLHTGTLNVYGGTNLDGGDIRGTTIGCLPTIEPPIVNTVRFEVLPIGIFATCLAPLPIEITTTSTLNLQSVGVATLTSGGVVNLAAGIRIELDSQTFQAKNSTSGADNTHLYIGNVQPAIDGTADLFIQGDDGRGVQLKDGVLVETARANISRTFVPSYIPYPTWNTTTLYDLGTIVLKDGVSYIQANYSTLNLAPDDVIPIWVSGYLYNVGNVVKENAGDGTSYICNTAGIYITPPSSNPAFDSVPSGDTGYYWELITTIANRDSIIFSPADLEPVYYSFYKPTGSDTICIAERSSADDTFIRAGQLYDSVINIPPANILPVLGDLNMAGYNIVNLGGISNPTGIQVNADLYGQNVFGLHQFNYYEAVATATGHATLRFKCANGTTALELSNGGENSPNITMFAPNGELGIDSSRYTKIAGGVGVIIQSDTTFSNTRVDGINHLGLNVAEFGSRWLLPYTIGGSSYFCYTYDSGATISAIASDWSKFPALAAVDIGGQDIVNASSIAVNTITSYTNPSILFRNDVDMGVNMITNCKEIDVDNIRATGSGPIVVYNDLDMSAKTITNLFELDVDVIASSTGSAIISHSTLDMNGNSIVNASQVSTDNLYGTSGTTISVHADLDMSYHALTNVSNLFKYVEFVRNSTITLTSNTPTRMPFNTTSVSGSGFSLNGNGDVVCNSAGTYRLILTTNLSKSSGGVSQVDVWFRLNGADVAYSNQQFSIQNNSGHDSLTTSRLLTLAVNDVVGCYFASSNASVVANYLAPQTTPYAHPSSPSVCLNIVIV